MNPSKPTDACPTPPPPPPRASHHRRAHSDTTFRFSGDDDDDEFLFDIDNILEIPYTLPTPMAVDASRSDESSGDNRPSSTSSRAHQLTGGGTQQSQHVRSFSVDADFFEGVGGGERKGGHRRTGSMDGGSSTSGLDGESVVGIDGVKKAMPPERLAELALIDPKRAKRILANRQSAARSKERKIRYTSELERKVQTLQTEATTLSAQVTMLQRDTTGLNTENKELTLRLQALEQQAQLRDALNEALRQEVQRLRIATGQISSGNSNSLNRGGLFTQFSTPLQNFTNQQNHQDHQPLSQPQQPQQPHQLQFQMPNQPSPSNQTMHKQLQPSFMDFNHRA